MTRHITHPDDIEAILTDPAFTVRPGTEPVPAPLIGSRLGAIFGLLPRFTDGPAHHTNRTRTEQVIAGIEANTLDYHVSRALEALHGTTLAHDWITSVCPLALAFAFDADIAIADVSALARGLGPGADPAALVGAIDATDRLWAALGAALPDHRTRAAAIGLLFQGFDSMSGLLGSALVANAASDLPATSRIRRILIEQPPIRNTRRFDSADDSVLVIDLDAATQGTGGQPSYAFGFGDHRCPGQILAFTIASRALEQPPCLIDVPVPLTYLSYPNARVPDLRSVALDWSSL